MINRESRAPHYLLHGTSRMTMAQARIYFKKKLNFDIDAYFSAELLQQVMSAYTTNGLVEMKRIFLEAMSIKDTPSSYASTSASTSADGAAGGATAGNIDSTGASNGASNGTIAAAGDAENDDILAHRSLLNGAMVTVNKMPSSLKQTRLSPEDIERLLCSKCNERLKNDHPHASLHKMFREGGNSNNNSNNGSGGSGGGLNADARFITRKGMYKVLNQFDIIMDRLDFNAFFAKHDRGDGNIDIHRFLKKLLPPDNVNDNPFVPKDAADARTEHQLSNVLRQVTGKQREVGYLNGTAATRLQPAFMEHLSGHPSGAARADATHAMAINGGSNGSYINGNNSSDNRSNLHTADTIRDTATLAVEAAEAENVNVEAFLQHLRQKRLLLELTNNPLLPNAAMGGSVSASAAGNGDGESGVNSRSNSPATASITSNSFAWLRQQSGGSSVPVQGNKVRPASASASGSGSMADSTTAVPVAVYPHYRPSSSSSSAHSHSTTTTTTRGQQQKTPHSIITFAPIDDNITDDYYYNAAVMRPRPASASSAAARRPHSAAATSGNSRSKHDIEAGSISEMSIVGSGASSSVSPSAMIVVPKVRSVSPTTITTSTDTAAAAIVGVEVATATAAPATTPRAASPRPNSASATASTATAATTAAATKPATAQPAPARSTSASPVPAVNGDLFNTILQGSLRNALRDLSFATADAAVAPVSTSSRSATAATATVTADTSNAAPLADGHGHSGPFASAAVAVHSARKRPVSASAVVRRPTSAAASYLGRDNRTGTASTINADSSSAAMAATPATAAAVDPLVQYRAQQSMLLRELADAYDAKNVAAMATNQQQSAVPRINIGGADTLTSSAGAAAGAAMNGNNFHPSSRQPAPAKRPSTAPTGRSFPSPRGIKMAATTDAAAMNQNFNNYDGLYVLDPQYANTNGMYGNTITTTTTAPSTSRTANTTTSNNNTNTSNSPPRTARTVRKFETTINGLTSPIRGTDACPRFVYTGQRRQQHTDPTSAVLTTQYRSARKHTTTSAEEYGLFVKQFSRTVQKQSKLYEKQRETVSPLMQGITFY